MIYPKVSSRKKCSSRFCSFVKFEVICFEWQKHTTTKNKAKPAFFNFTPGPKWILTHFVIRLQKNATWQNVRKAIQGKVCSGEMPLISDPNNLLSIKVILINGLSFLSTAYMHHQWNWKKEVCRIVKSKDSFKKHSYCGWCLKHYYWLLNGYAWKTVWL